MRTIIQKKTDYDFSNLKTEEDSITKAEKIVQRIKVNEARLLKDKIENLISILEEQIRNSDVNDHDMSKIVLKEKCHGLSEILDLYIKDKDFSAFPKIHVFKEKIGPLYEKACQRILKDLIHIYPDLNKYVKIGFIDLSKKKLKMLEYKFREEVLEKNNDDKKK